MSQRQHNEDRMRRAWSWHSRSGRAESNEDRFIFLWIAFNAAYGDELHDPNIYNPRENGEKKKLEKFLREAIVRDKGNTIRDILWEQLSDCQVDRQLRGLVPRLLDSQYSQYVFRPFWNLVHGRGDAGNWRGLLKDWNRTARNILLKSKVQVREEEIRRLLWEVFARLYTLRNQVFHGGVTWGEGQGRKQLRDGAEIMGVLVPAILRIMQADIDENEGSDAWGVVAFPHVDENGQLVDVQDTAHQARISK